MHGRGPCWIGPAQAAALPSMVFDWTKNEEWGHVFAQWICHGTAPLWLRYVRRDALLASLAYGGCADVCGGLASEPFSFGPDDARTMANFALR